MALKLNNLPEERVRKNLARSLKAVEKCWPEAQGNVADHKLNKRVACSSSKVGYMLYQQERESAAKDNFYITAITTSRAYYYRSVPTGEHETRNAWSFFKGLNMVICFGGVTEVDLLNNTKEIKYHNYPNEPIQNQFLADCINALKSYLEKNTIDSNTLMALVNAAAQNNRNNECDWQACIQRSLDGHLREIKVDGYSRDHEGFICMPGLALIKLGQRKGWVNIVDSPYLPVRLLDA